MDVSNYQFSDEEIARLHQYRDNQDDAPLKARLIALLMLAEGIEINKVASIIGKSIKTIENWHRQYRSKGIDSLNFFQYKPKQSYLNDEQIEQLVSWVKTTNPAKLKQIRQYIKDYFWEHIILINIALVILREKKTAMRIAQLSTLK